MNSDRESEGACHQPRQVESDAQKIWDQRFLALAEHVGSWSKDGGRKVGTVIVDKSLTLKAVGYNGFPRQVRDDIEERYVRPLKYKWTEHAERNAIYSAAKQGISIDGCVIYIPWFPCVECTRAIIQSGITRVVCIQPDFNDPQWGDDFKIAISMLKEAKISICYYSEIQTPEQA
jgi:dCMP deaminase